MSTLRGRGSVQGLPEWDRCAVMGVVNVTPDSFSDGGRWFDTTAAVKHGIDLVAQGADLVDVGGESTRPGAPRVDEDEELKRVVPVVRGLAAEGVTVSVDTMRATVAEQALAAGAALVNDVSGGLADPRMVPAVAAAHAPFVVMHWRGFLTDIHAKPHYENVLSEVVDELHARVEAAIEGGIAPERIVVDPGLGFSKEAEHDLTLLAHLKRLRGLGHPILVAASRKRFLGRVLAGPEGAPPPARERDAATAAVSAIAAHQGAWAVRVHEVRATADAVRVARAVTGAAGGPSVTAARTDIEQVQLANTAFYEALERGDFDEVSDLWLDSEDTPESSGGTEDAEDAEDAEGAQDGDTAGDAVSCVHPGWPVLTGRGEVLRSYALIMANTEYIQFFLTDLKVGVAGDTALVTCTENILSGGPPPEGGGELGPLVGQLVVATNVFRRTPDGWKLWSHHASPVLAETDDEEDEETPT